MFDVNAWAGSPGNAHKPRRVCVESLRYASLLLASMTIVRAAQHDVDVIAPLFDAYRVFYKAASNLQASHNFITERLANDESVIFLACDGNNAAIGFVQLYPSFDSVQMQRLWILNDLFVDPYARTGGAGAALLAAERFAREDDAVGLTLSTAVDNHTAQRLYERAGYVRDETFFVSNRMF
jgi:ribosomal protein S18 acetylase RimI-like enzyme